MTALRSRPKFACDCLLPACAELAPQGHLLLEPAMALPLFVKTLQVYASADLARWSLRATTLQKPQLGLQCMDHFGLLAAVGEALWGAPMSDAELQRRLREVLNQPQHQARFALAGLQGPAAGLLRTAILGQLTEWHAAGVDPEWQAPTERERSLLAVLKDWRAQFAAPGWGTWYVGQAQEMLAAGAAQLPFLRDQGVVVAAVDARFPQWMVQWLQTAVGERLQRAPLQADNQTAPTPTVLACNSPAVERLEVARRVLASKQPCAVVVPAAEVGMWATQLRQLGVPVVAYLQGTQGTTRVEKMLRAWADLRAGRPVARQDVAELVVGNLPDWSQRAAPVPTPTDAGDDDDNTSEQARTLRDEARKLWTLLRRSSGTLAQWQQRIEPVRKLAVSQLTDREARGLHDEAETQAGTARIEAAERELTERLDLLASAVSCADVVQLLRTLQLTRRTARLPLEGAAAQSAVAALVAAGDADFAQTWPNIAAGGLAGTRGMWLQTSIEGRAPCWLVPWGGVPQSLPPVRFLCGLDAYPGTASEEPWLSQQTLQQLHLPTAAGKADQARAECERVLAGAAEAALSYRTLNGVGGVAGPSPWLLQLLEAGLAQHKIVIPRADAANTSGLCAPPWTPVLERRRQLVLGHRDPNPGPWTGQLGIRVPASDRGYSVSTLQVFACNPYRYFLERVVGLREQDPADDALDAREQGNVLHAALEKPLRERLQAGAVDLRDALDELKVASLQTVAKEYGITAKDILADAVWQGEAGRWREELEMWFAGRMAEIREEQPDGLRAEQDADEEIVKHKTAIAGYKGFLAEPTDENLQRLKKELRARANTGWYTTCQTMLTQQASDEARFGVESKLADAEHAVLRREAAIKKKFELRVAPFVLAVEHPLQAGPGQPLQLDLGEGVVLPMQGSIDRVEWHRTLQTLLVVDYKTGKPDTKLGEKLSTGEHLQLPLYALALESQVRSGAFASSGVASTAAVVRGRLEYLRRKSGVKAHSVTVVPLRDAGAVTDRLAVASGHARQFVQAIESGEFPLVQRAGTDWQGRLSVAMRRIAPVALQPGEAQLDGARSLGRVSVPSDAGALSQST